MEKKIITACFFFLISVFFSGQIQAELIDDPESGDQAAADASELYTPSESEGDDDQPQALSTSFKIRKVDREFMFVVLQGGITNGIKKGDTLTVFKDGEAIAKVKVEKLYSNFCAAGILEEKAGRQIIPGDEARKES